MRRIDLADDKLTRFALRLVLPGIPPIPRESEIDFLTEAEAACSSADKEDDQEEGEEAAHSRQRGSQKKTAAKKKVAA